MLPILENLTIFGFSQSVFYLHKFWMVMNFWLNWKHPESPMCKSFNVGLLSLNLKLGFLFFTILELKVRILIFNSKFKLTYRNPNSKNELNLE